MKRTRPRRLARLLPALWLSVAVAASAAPAPGATPAPAREILRWGGDAEGGAPFVEADPSDPARVRGFDVEVAEAIARGLGRQPVFVQVSFSSIDASVARGDFDIGMSGVEDTPARRSMLAATIPYFEFREVLTVREADRERLRGLEDLRGRRVGTLGATIAYDFLLENRGRFGYEPVSYDDDVHPYTDLAAGRLDAVLLDNIIAARSVRRVPGLAVQPGAAVTGRYVGVLAKGNTALRDRINRVLAERMRDGTLERGESQAFVQRSLWLGVTSPKHVVLALNGASPLPLSGTCPTTVSVTPQQITQQPTSTVSCH